MTKAVEANRLSVRREELAVAWRPLRMVKRHSTEEAVISWQAGELRVQLAGMSLGVLAEGVWSVEVRVPAVFIVGLAKTLPKSDAIELAWKDGRFRVGAAMVRGTEQTSGSAKIVLPLNPNLKHLVRIGLHEDWRQIAASGLSKTVDEAMERMKSRVEEACRILEPLGITEADIEDLVRRAAIAAPSRNDQSPKLEASDLFGDRADPDRIQ